MTYYSFRIGHWTTQDKMPELIDDGIKKLFEKVQQNSTEEFPTGKCHGCGKLLIVPFIVTGKEKIPQWKFCSATCIRKELSLTKSKGWTDKTSKKKGEEINLVTEEESSKKNEKNKTKK